MRHYCLHNIESITDKDAVHTNVVSGLYEILQNCTQLHQLKRRTKLYIRTDNLQFYGFSTEFKAAKADNESCLKLKTIAGFA